MANAELDDAAGTLTGADRSAEGRAADWVAANYHPEWHFGTALRSGIGVRVDLTQRKMPEHKPEARTILLTQQLQNLVRHPAVWALVVPVFDKRDGSV